MSFETARANYFDTNKCWKPETFRDARLDAFTSGWDAKASESEAQIAALQSERDALREASKHAHDLYVLDVEEDGYGVQFDAAMDNLKRVLSTPASGEPARKP